mgnify:CR=1 FL=1
MYKFSDGLPMGKTLSSIVTNVFMDDLESHFLNSDALSSNIRFWARYVDDVICIWYGRVTDL